MPSLQESECTFRPLFKLISSIRQVTVVYAMLKCLKDPEA